MTSRLIQSATSPPTCMHRRQSAYLKAPCRNKSEGSCNQKGRHRSAATPSLFFLPSLHHRLGPQPPDVPSLSKTTTLTVRFRELLEAAETRNKGRWWACWCGSCITLTALIALMAGCTNNKTNESNKKSRSSIVCCRYNTTSVFVPL